MVISAQATHVKYCPERNLSSLETEEIGQRNNDNLQNIIDGHMDMENSPGDTVKKKKRFVRKRQSERLFPCKEKALVVL